MKPKFYKFTLGLALVSFIFVAVVSAATFVDNPGWFASGDQNPNNIQGIPDSARFGLAIGFAPVSQNFGNAFVPLPVNNTIVNPQTSPISPSRDDFSAGGFLSFPLMNENSFVPLPGSFGNPQVSPAAPSSGFSGEGFAPISQTNPANPAPSFSNPGSFNSPYIGPAVDFQVVTGTYSSCGLTCRRTTATVTNIGSQTAHNVRIVMEVRNNADKVMNVNGGPSYERPIGNLESGQSVSVPISVNVDCPDLMKCQDSLPFNLRYSVVSTELTKKFPDILFTG